MRHVALALLSLSILPSAVIADEPKDPAPAARTARDAYLFVFDDAATKLESLAEAIPADKYDWRPAEGVRSVGEAFQHVAGSVYLLAGMAGAAIPDGAPKSFDDLAALEKKSSKTDVTASLARALAFAREAAVGATPEQLEKAVDFFGSAVDGRTVLLVLNAHLHEHLGQLIAYARSAGVAPPWSRPLPTSEKKSEGAGY